MTDKLTKYSFMRLVFVKNIRAIQNVKKAIYFIAAVLLTAATVSACTTDPKNTSSAGQGAQASKTESSLYSGSDSFTQSLSENSSESNISKSIILQ